MSKLTSEDVKATADTLVDMLIRSLLLNTDSKANSKNTHVNCAIWEDHANSIDFDVAPNRTDKTTGEDCRRGTI